MTPHQASSSVNGVLLFLPCLGCVHKHLDQRLNAVLRAIVGQALKLVG